MAAVSGGGGGGLDSLEMQTDPDVDPGGYQVALKNPLPLKWQCPFCNLLMKDAIQTYRGEMACESCFLKAKGDSKICPIDKEPIGDEEFFQDRHARREILQLNCYCCNKENGCDWEGIVNDFRAHNNTCDYQLLNCINCQQMVNRLDMERHLKDLCEYRELKCPYCDVTLSAQSLRQHEASCLMKPVNCPYMCGENIQLSSVYDHVQTCGKVNQGDICPYQLVGCKKEVEKSLLAGHLAENVDVHAAMTISTVKFLEQSNEKLKHDLLTEQNLRSDLVKKVQEQNQKQRSMQEEMNVWKLKFEELNEEITKIKGLSESSVKEIENGLKEMDLKASGTNVEQIDAKLNELGQKYNEVEDKIKRGFGGSGEGEGSGSSVAKKVDDLESGSAVLSANLSDLELRLQLLENTCYDGRQLWKVDNVTHRINQAVTGQVTALHSAPCFQKRGGYRFCSRLYLNGDGMGRGTHVSLFFVLMKSEYDALLTWPFRERVTFRLINPHNVEESLTESFIPDPNSSSFKRPTKDMNIAAGCPMFIRRENLYKYIVDDAIYIETKIVLD